MSADPSPIYPVNHVLVDYENVQDFDVSILQNKNLMVLLFLGPGNKKLEVELVQGLLAHANAVQLIRSPKIGKNALDFVLSFYLGQAVQMDPKGYFHLISKDGGYDSLVELLQLRKIKIRRHEDWKGLIHYWEQVAISKKTEGSAKASVSAPIPKRCSEEAEGLLQLLQKSPKNRPKKEKTLLTHAMSYLGKAKQNVEKVANRVISELKSANYLEIDEKGNVSYAI